MKYFISILVFLTVCHSIAVEGQPKLPVQVYYEALCPDCVQFFAKQLCPVWKRMGTTFDIKLFPYGNAKKIVDPSGNITIECQHGKAECFGNTMHACAINKFPEPIATKFVCCTMAHRHPSKAGSTCAKSLEINYKVIQDCTQSTQGFNYLNEYGNLTDQLQPPHTFVPWILFNGIYNATDMGQAQDHFKSVLCKYLKQKPPTCNEIF